MLTNHSQDTWSWVLVGTNRPSDYAKYQQNKRERLTCQTAEKGSRCGAACDCTWFGRIFPQSVYGEGFTSVFIPGTGDLHLDVVPLPKTGNEQRKNNTNNGKYIVAVKFKTSRISFWWGFVKMLWQNVSQTDTSQGNQNLSDLFPLFFFSIFYFSSLFHWYLLFQLSWSKFNMPP